MVAILLLALPLAAGVVAALTPWRRWVGWLATAAIGGVLVAGVAGAVIVRRDGPVTALGGVVRLDALSAFMTIVIGAVGVLAASQSVRYLDDAMRAGRCSVRHASLYSTLVLGFISAMVLAVVAANVGVMWVAIEATTVITTFLVGHRQTRGALEASWKYVIICSVGIALAFLATVLVYLAELHNPQHHLTSLDWTSLMSVAHHLDPSVMRFAFALVILGYGTKVGLAPMHSWLPDAHSQAPAPVSALMSGVLLSVAFYAILRFKAIADAALGVAFPRALLVVAGLLSLLVAASLLIRQRDYKRMFAYSSIEHMGLLALGAAAGSPLAIAAVLLHILGHGLAKAVLFLASGEVLALEGTSETSQVRALLARRPVLGGVLAGGFAALLGLPPFSLFISELNMLRAEVRAGLAWVVALTLVALVVVFAAMATHARTMLLGARREGEAVHATPAAVSVPLVAALVGCGALGVVAWPLASLLHAAAQVVAR